MGEWLLHRVCVCHAFRVDIAAADAVVEILLFKAVTPWRRTSRVGIVDRGVVLWCQFETPLIQNLRVCWWKGVESS